MLLARWYQQQLKQHPDAPQAISYLKQRGLVEETLVVFGGEFGRTVYSQGTLTKENSGRDHHPRNFCMWMAGGGIRGGMAHGATDELGFHAIEPGHYVTDMHATVLHLLGLNGRRLEIPGRKRLEMDHGKPIFDIFS